MFKTFWNMEFNPFDKSLNTKYHFQSNDFKEATSRLEHLKSIKGIGLFTGSSGSGKTFSLRYFSNSLNQNLFKPVYISMSTVSVLEFYKALNYGLDLENSFKKIDLFKKIQERIISLAKDKKITPVLIIDEAQYLKTEILNDLKILFNFEMDSKNYAMIILSGQPVLNNILSKHVHESLKQRIVINYNYSGLSKAESDDYIVSRLKISGVHNQIFNANSLEAIHGCSSGSVRKLNNIIEKCLMIGCQKRVDIIDTEIVMAAQNEIELI